MGSSILGPKEIEMFEGQALLYRQCCAYIDSMCIKWCVELNIADIIHNHGQPITLHHLVSTLQVPSSRVAAVRRFMRYLAHNGLFHIVRIHDENKQEKEAYGLTIASKLLVSSNDYCLSPMVKYATDPVTMGPLNQLKAWIYGEDNLSLFGMAKGMEFWEFLNINPKYLKSFNEAMACDSKMINLALRSCGLVFDGLESIVDVGGGIGTTAKIISEAFPKLKCIVFDLPQVVENLLGTNNLSFVGGDMFKSIPKAHAVLLKNIIHDWDEENCVKIMRNCKDAISSNGKRGKVIIIESVINEKQDKHEITEMKLKYDIYMTCNNGAQKTEEELKKIFIEAGFQGYKLFPIAGIVSLVEVYP
ncbi:hypothetical protein HN51_067925 [Arachis hypogaea]|uniref:isoflavone 7-O-methyltransferase-like n=1 Tax=Arachis ipaensis TaxID=130454 RepID=UPI0007AF59ED|nr:isoflavone 7-O-methyltransferase-like [Arachis ipaensis]XP_025645086.1 isoflavone 7-O-methyltransferase-like [Arachis hypogaea]QHO09420.1 Isoflavone 7-O-methyltransferase [Arachis hypogaea]